jgi:hypothetical protein
MLDRSSSEVRCDLDAGVGFGIKLIPIGPEFTGGLVPGWSAERPRGVSRITRKCPVNGGPRVAGRVSGST